MILFLRRSRQGGKTNQMIDWVRDDPDNRVIIAINDHERHRLIRTYKLPPSCVDTFERRRRTGYGQSPKQYAIDNLDIFLSQLLPGGKVEAATLTEHMHQL